MVLITVASVSSPPQRPSAWKRMSSSWLHKRDTPTNQSQTSLSQASSSQISLHHGGSWPATLDKESNKAAAVLRSFCIDGFMSEQGGGRRGRDRKERSLDHIPPEVIRQCKGLVIFTVTPMGVFWSGKAGTGVVVSRLPNGQWSAPSSINIHTLGWGFVALADIYECVCVINDDRGIDELMHPRCTLGAAVSGPLGGGWAVDPAVFKSRPAMWTYIKSNGLHLGVRVDGTVLVEHRSDNRGLYGAEKTRSKHILAGRVTPPPYCTGLDRLWETLRAAEGSSYDPYKLPAPDDDDDELAMCREKNLKAYRALVYNQEEDVPMDPWEQFIV